MTIKEAMKQKLMKSGNRNPGEWMYWVIPDFYLSFRFTDPLMAEAWITRDSYGLSVRVGTVFPASHSLESLLGCIDMDMKADMVRLINKHLAASDEIAVRYGDWFGMDQK